MSRFCYLRICGKHLMDQIRLHDVAADTQDLDWFRRWWEASGGASYDAAENATGRTAGNAAWHAAGHADVRLRLFLDHLNFFRDDRGSHELALLNELRLRLDVHDGGRRWRRRGRRRSDQEGGHHRRRQRAGIDEGNQDQDTEN